MTKAISGVNGMQSQHGYSVAFTVRGAHETNAISVSVFSRLATFPKLETAFLETKMWQCMSIWKASDLPKYFLIKWSSWLGPPRLLHIVCTKPEQVSQINRALWKLAWVVLCLVRASIWSLTKVKANIRYVSLVTNNAICKSSYSSYLINICRWIVWWFRIVAGWQSVFE